MVVAASVTCQTGDVDFEFIADRPALDFVPTLAERGTTDEERLRTPADLVAWARQSGVVDDLDRVTPQQLEHARAVRDAIFGLVAALIDGTDPAPAHRELVNDAAAHPLPRLRLEPDGRIRRTGGIDALLAALAADCLDLHTSPDRHALRWCDDGKCTRPFVDRSHGRRRRWCGMKGCGDRAKAVAYRRRRRSAEMRTGSGRNAR
jgi:predicted RNA-binding Zn ribbon-like protein